jgi:hypothetical protein
MPATWVPSLCALTRTHHHPSSFAGLLEMYSFRVHPKDARIVVRIDKPADRCVQTREGHFPNSPR